MKNVILSWSGGKDSALSLYKLYKNPELNITGFHCTFSEKNKRSGLHGIREELIKTQAFSSGYEFYPCYLKDDKSYESEILRSYKFFKAQGIDAIVFGDIFLKDLKEYRESLLKQSGLEGIYPLWGMNTEDLMTEFYSSEIRSLICAVNEEKLSIDFLGKELSQSTVLQFPSNIDPAGENGEYHSFVYEAPFFQMPLKIQKGEIVKKELVLNEAVFKNSYIDLFL